MKIMLCYFTNKNGLWWKICWSIFAIYILHKCRQALAKYLRRGQLLKAIAERRAQRQTSIAEAHHRLQKTPKSTRDNIAALRNCELLQALKDDVYSPLEVLHTYWELAIKAHEKTNCLTEIILEADEQAVKLLEIPKDQRGLLYGMPFTVKESNQMMGYDSTRGYAAALNKPVVNDCHAIIFLRDLHHGVPHVRTNVPQSLLSYSCSNPIYGRTTNPYSQNRTSGGSSGGDAACVALHGGTFGLGGDVGGSIRIPSSYCGIVGIKPTSTRISQIGSLGSVPGRPLICSSEGPITPDVFTADLVMRALSGRRAHDFSPYAVPLEWTPIKEKKLRIGYFESSNFFPVTPGVQRALRETRQLLEQRGHVFVDFKIPVDLGEVAYVFTSACTVDGSQYLMSLLVDDIIEPDHIKFVRLMQLPSLLRRPTLAKLIHGKRVALLAAALQGDRSSLRQRYARLMEIRDTIAQYWRDLGIDCLLCPPLPSPALYFDYPMKIPGGAIYCMMFNLLDYPGGVVSVTKVTQNDIDACQAEYDGTVDDWANLIKIASTRPDAIGLPIGVQCVAKHLDDELCVYLMQQVEDCYNK